MSLSSPLLIVLSGAVSCLCVYVCLCDLSMYEAESDMDVNMAESHPDTPAHTAPATQRSTSEIVDYLEVDSAEERSDADSSIGSEVSSYVTWVVRPYAGADIMGISASRHL